MNGAPIPLEQSGGASSQLTCVAGIGDVDGDGVGDIAIGSISDGDTGAILAELQGDGAAPRGNRVFLYRGSSAANAFPLMRTLVGAGAVDIFGNSIAGM